MSDFVIETKKLTKIYGEQTAVNSVDIHVKPGRIYGLLGRNGAGKTTIMKMILGLTPITSGEVDVFGQNIKGHEKRIYPRIGAIIETPGFYPNLTGTENLEIFAKLRGTPRPICRQERTGSRGTSLPGQKAVQQVFSWHEAAPRYR